MMHGFGFGGMWLGWLFWIVLIVVAVWAVKAVIDSQRQGPTSQARSGEALEILKQRFARGEIDEEEYQRRKAQLLD